MNQKGAINTTAILTVGLLIAAGMTGWYFMWVDDPGNFPKPPLPDPIVETGRARFVRSQITVTTPGFQWDSIYLDIEEDSIEKKIEVVPVSTFQTLAYWEETFTGELVVKIEDQDGNVKDQWSRNYEIIEGTWEYQESETYQTDWLFMGRIDSGRYQLIAEIYDETGNLKDSQEISVTS
jgi:hypothetical protein